MTIAKIIIGILFLGIILYLCSCSRTLTPSQAARGAKCGQYLK